MDAGFGVGRTAHRRYRSGKWQARIPRAGEQNLVKTFQTKADALK